VVVLSSNYELYGDMSRRVTSVLARFAPELEIYSIDESFLNLSGVESPLLLSQRIRKTVGRWTGIPISIGMGKTKTLAKLANRLAKKKKTGCFEVSAGQDEVLSGIPVEDIWGVGPRLSIRLQRVGLTNALRFARAPSSMIRSIGGVTLERTQRELSGIPCLEMEQVPQPRKNTCSSRSFGRPVESLSELEEAVANYAVKATRKIRSEGSLASALQVFIKTNRFREDQEQYSNARTLAFDEPTDDLIRVVKNAKSLLRSIYRKGYAYKKAGVLLIDLIPKGAQQGLLFEEHGNPRRKEFVDVLEEVASQYGQACAFLGAQGVKQ
jgi:DNA polymerase V